MSADVVREAIDAFYTHTRKDPFDLGKGRAWIVGSESTDGIHIVFRSYEGKGWACDCQGFQFGHVCYHIREQMAKSRRGRARG